MSRDRDLNNKKTGGSRVEDVKTFITSGQDWQD